MAPHRRKNPIARRRRLEDEGDDEGSPYVADLDDDDSLSDSTLSDPGAPHEVNDGGRAASHTSSPELQRNGSGVNGHAKVANGSGSTPRPKSARAASSSLVANGSSDTDLMLHGLKIAETDQAAATTTTAGASVAEPAVNYDDTHQDLDAALVNDSDKPSTTSTAHMDLPQQPAYERRRREHEEYKKRRDADPAFVPNRGAFFMHDHRHAGPAANGFRPFGRPRGRGRGIGGPFSPANHMPHPPEPTDAPWTHDMHETVLHEPAPKERPMVVNGQGNATEPAPAADAADGPANRSLSTTKHIGNVQIRVFLAGMEKPVVFPGIPVKQYTRLPDRRPPLRRDKPVRISLPDHPPRYIFPAVDRSFIFIPRAMRPNQQGFGGRSNRGRSGLGSMGGFSRRTSIYGGSVFGSVYTPSIAMSRRSSLAHEISRDHLISPTGSTMSRPPIPMDHTRPVVRLPPAQGSTMGEPGFADAVPPVDGSGAQGYPLPQKPTYRENRPNSIPMHQPRPQKAVSVADIESPASMNYNASQSAQQQPFHQQVPPQVNGHGYDPMHPHSRQPSYSQASTGTPLSHIPERAIHAQPFQPNPYQAPAFYPQTYQMVPQQPGYYYPPTYNPTMAPAGQPAFVPAAPPPPPPPQSDAAAGQAGLVAQEVNGMVYYYDASQLPAMNTYPAYTAPQGYPMQQAGGVVGMGGMMTPSPDGFYYPQAPQGMVYYPQ